VVSPESLEINSETENRSDNLSVSLINELIRESALNTRLIFSLVDFGVLQSPAIPPQELIHDHSPNKLDE
jgi:hypothetical protein